MELKKRTVQLEKDFDQILSTAGKVLGRLTMFTLSAYGFAKLVKYLIKTW